MHPLDEATTTNICLTQYLQHGNTRLNKRSLKLSLDDTEINHYICRRDDLMENEEEFELLGESCQGLTCLAIIHTQNGFACLEALVEQVSIPLLGLGFDARSAHAFQLKPSDPEAWQRSTLQLRPGEPFYVQDLALTLVPEKSHQSIVQLASGGTVPSYDEYSQHVSQKGETQPLTSPCPNRSDWVSPDLMITPTRSKPTTLGCTPLAHQMSMSPLSNIKTRHQRSLRGSVTDEVVSALLDVAEIDNNVNQKQLVEGDGRPTVPRIVEGSTTQDQSSQLQVKIETAHPDSNLLREAHGTEQVNGFKPSLGKRRNDGQGSTEVQESSSLPGESSYSSPVIPPSTVAAPHPPQSWRDLQALGEDQPQSTAEDTMTEPAKQERRLAYNPENESIADSEDSLAGKTIEVAATVASCPSTKRPRYSRKQTKSVTSHSGTRHPHTPTEDRSLNQSPPQSIEYSSSIRSTRSVLRENSHRLNVQSGGTRILFASSTAVGDSKAFKKFLTEKGVEIVQDIKAASCLCIGKGEIKKTSKLISAAVLGKDIITDEWVRDSARLKTLQDIESYCAKDTKREEEWGMKLDEAVARGKQKVQVLKGINVVFTPKAKKELGNTGFTDLKDIAMYAGAADVGTSLSKASWQDDITTLVVGTSEDCDTPALDDKRFFNKDIIGLSVLRGTLDLESDEFVVKKEPPQVKGSRKRKR